ncbi:uncharacterized protein LOC121867789 isoform X2 [Homarus americanus]|uniref:uncharacterized protein LOC121867789 isoform X2 n=1 Tax=Homarus americanus TaxID=6706 RepID=UPI001C465991|nr:uncharacterized protein LOC121867789 isoform X2 [Homarus americanus]
MKASLLVSLALVAVAHAGTCPKYPIIRDFDFHRYMGLWYQQDKLQASWEAPGRCWKTLYSRDRKNGQFKMKMIFKSTITGRVEEYDSQLTLQGPAKPSIIKYTIPLTFMEDEYQVLATDYESFSLEYKCDPNGLLEKSESIWLLTREKNPSPLVLQRAYAIMHHLGVDIRKLERVDQTCGGIDIGGSLSSVDYDYYSTGPQVLTDNRRFQPHQEFYQYDDYYEPAGGFQSASAVPVPQPSESPSNQFAVSFPVQDTDSNIRRRPRPPQRYGSSLYSSSFDYDYFPSSFDTDHQDYYESEYRKPNLKRQSIPTDERISLGQSLATRLWHVLHSPVRK